MDNAGTHIYETLYWAQELAMQNDDQNLKERFSPVAQKLEANIDKIFEEMNAMKNQAKDIGGYYRADPVKVAAAMRPSATFNKILESLGA